MRPEVNNIISLNNEIIEDLKIELAAQGHELTGKTAASLHAVSKLENGTIILEGAGSFVVAILNEGVKPQKVSWKQYPFLYQYFLKKGLPPKEAKKAAGGTIVVGMREGFPTKASHRFSETGKRTGAVQAVFKENQERYQKKVGEGLKLMMSNLFHQVKSETV